MPRTPKDLTTYGGSLLDPVEENIDLSPSDPVAMEVVREILRLVAALALPQLLEVAKSVAALHGLAWQRRKAERAKDLVVALYDLLQRTRFEYVQKVEFEDLFEEVFRRFSEQPDSDRRDTMRKIFLKIIEAPREHVENRLLIRLADELPSEALRALSVLDRKLTQEEREPGVGYGALAIRLGVSNATRLLAYLVNENLVDEHSTSVAPGFGAAGDDLTFLLTPLGRTFVEYGRG
jgi:hypothetical protein